MRDDQRQGALRADQPRKQAKYDAQRRLRDEIFSLPDGFTLKSYGRNGTIYYREGAMLMELGCEMSGVPEYDIIVYIDRSKAWVQPDRTAVDLTKQRS